MMLSVSGNPLMMQAFHRVP